MAGFLEALREQRWDDHRYYHHSRINQTLHLISALSFLWAYALLLINPHTSFFFRSELQMASGEGLDAYGAVTWGQFFIYQGFNPRVGWMHTSSGVDAVDEYLETVHTQNGHHFYKYGDGERPVVDGGRRRAVDADNP